MLRRLARSALAHGLGQTGADRSLGRLSGVAQEPLVLGYHRVLPDGPLPRDRGVPNMGVSVRTLERQLEFVGRRFRFVSLDELGAALEEGAGAGSMARSIPRRLAISSSARASGSYFLLASTKPHGIMNVVTMP